MTTYCAKTIKDAISRIMLKYDATRSLPVNANGDCVLITAMDYALMQVIIAQQTQIDELFTRQLEIATLRTALAALKQQAAAHEQAHKSWEFEGF